MNGLHSVWLMPEAAHEAMLQHLVDELAARFGAPRFRPHLTLVEDQPRSVDDLTPRIEQIATGMEAFVVPIRAIGTSELHFRSFYALFDAAGPLLELKRRAIETVAPGRIEDFMPHISLLYGVPDGPEKRAAQAGVEKRLAGMAIRFDRACVVASAKEIPIEAWKIRSTVALKATAAVAREGPAPT
jgi:2'-5' RNA ligase